MKERLTAYDEYEREDEVLQEWSSLPVEIEYVLDSLSLTLAELDEIMPGTALPLNPDAEKKVRIYLNKKLFARGELVALENGPLAVEVNHVNFSLIGDAELTDAK